MVDAAGKNTKSGRVTLPDLVFFSAASSIGVPCAYFFVNSILIERIIFYSIIFYKDR